MNRPDDRDWSALISGYLDGELDPNERREFEERVARDPALARELDAVRATKGVMANMKLREFPDEVWERYWKGTYNRLERRVGWLVFWLGGRPPTGGRPVRACRLPVTGHGRSLVGASGYRRSRARPGRAVRVGVARAAVRLETGSLQGGHPMIVTTTDSVPGRETAEVLGLVRGNTIRARHLGKDIVALLRNIVGGEIGEYTKLMAESREQAMDRMVERAEELGADAVIEVRFTTSMIMSQAAEILAYGTAVRLR